MNVEPIPNARRKKSKHGAPLAWLRANADYDANSCLVWPFARTPEGRAHMTMKRKTVKPSRLMCELAHGPAPSDCHQAAHSCGNANGGCVSPRHLRWATPVENAADRVTHGTTARGERAYNAKLTADDVYKIRSAPKGTVKALSVSLGVSYPCVRNVRAGNTWRHLP